PRPTRSRSRRRRGPSLPVRRCGRRDADELDDPVDARSATRADPAPDLDVEVVLRTHSTARLAGAPAERPDRPAACLGALAGNPLLVPLRPGRCEEPH